MAGCSLKIEKRDLMRWRRLLYGMIPHRFRPDGTAILDTDIVHCAWRCCTLKHGRKDVKITRYWRRFDA